MTDSWLAKTTEHLEWARLVSAVLAGCRGPSARRRGLSLAQNREQAALLLREAAEAMGVSLSTLKRDWNFAKAWLLDRLQSGSTT